MHLTSFQHAASAALFAVGVSCQSSLTASYSNTLQTITGFGVSQAFGRAQEFYNMSPTPRQKGLDYLFSTTAGAGLTIVRNRVGSGTVASDSILPTSPGCPTCQPSYSWDGVDRGQVWFSKAAQSYGVQTFYADAWSAPGFMKTNGLETGGGYLCGVTGRTCSSGDWRQAYANMLAQYVKYYQQEGITITHLGFLNEPDYTTSYSSMQSNGKEAASFIPTLRNTLNNNGLSSVQLACCDAVGWSSQRTITTDLLSSGVQGQLGVITSHTYGSDVDGTINTSGLPVWVTEAADLNSAWCTTWYSNGGLCEGLTWAKRIATGIVTGNLSAYIYWQGVEVNQFQASSYLVASDGTNVTPSGRLWAFAMWSRYVRPGARRLSTTGTIPNVIWATLKNTDGSVVAVFTNTGGSAQSASLKIDGYIPTKASGWVVNNATGNNIASQPVSLSGGTALVSIPAYSVVTAVLNQ
ncbi:unnamed protein product [Clonostachys solani]|uniref:Uncharacterized protein n=1 Tax=Clonostachys solani TaxID=160281 RepID=A0A9N9YZB4_9HYPO|nr:unnamed protein product [Clonostachys solani]